MNDSIEIICPLYNAENYIKSLHESLLMQIEVNVKKIHYVVTKGNDATENILNSMNIKYDLILPSDFSHSLTREKAAFDSESDIIVFITQDVVIKRNDWLCNLVKGIEAGTCDAAYSRQIANPNAGIEKYIRQKNYPNFSFIVSKQDIENLGLKTFFFSDASAAINREKFIKLNGYDNKNLVISEDMYFAYKLIMDGGKISYCSDSVIIHSHDFTVSELYKRYFQTGKFFKENEYLEEYNVYSSGSSLALYVLTESIKEFNFKAIIMFFPNMIARWIGMQLGKKSYGK